MIVIGPTGRSVRLPSFPGRTYPDHAMAMPRARFDAILHDAALGGGAPALLALPGVGGDDPERSGSDWSSRMLASTS